jgi:hypothetical protein
METPTRSWAAQQGLKAGYGLSNYTSIHDGFVYHGHNGGVNGGLTEVAYLPDYNVGYFYSINAGSGKAFGKIGDAIRACITRGLTRPTVPAAAALPTDAQLYSGWYEPDSPRIEMTHFLERLGVRRVGFEHGKMVVSKLIGTINDVFIPVNGERFRHLPKKALPSRFQRSRCSHRMRRGDLSKWAERGGISPPRSHLPRSLLYSGSSRRSYRLWSMRHSGS